MNYLPRSFKFVVLKIASVDCSILRNIVTFANFGSGLQWSFITCAIGKYDFAMDETIVSKQAVLLVIFSDEFASSMVLMVSHLSVIGISIFFGEISVGAIAINKSSFESIIIGVVDLAFTVLFTAGVNCAFIVAAVEIGDFGWFNSHWITCKSNMDINKLYWNLGLISEEMLTFDKCIMRMKIYIRP